MDSNEEELEKGKIGDWMRDLALSGLATFFMTEDMVRGYLKERKLPKELAALLLEGVTKKKDDVYGLLAKEFGKFLSKADLSSELTKFLEKHRVSVSANITFEPRQPVKEG